MQGGGRIAPVSLLRRGHIRTADYTANAVDERRKLAFAANLHGGVELKKCRKQGISGSLDCLDNSSGSRFFYACFRLSFKVLHFANKTCCSFINSGMLSLVKNCAKVMLNVL